MKDNLGQEFAKGGFCPSSAKLEQLPLISLENDSVFLVLTLFSACLSLKSGFPTHTKNYIFEIISIGLFARKVS